VGTKGDVTPSLAWPGTSDRRQDRRPLRQTFRTCATGPSPSRLTS